MEFAVITGASRGLGKSFAYQLAKLKINLILVSLARENLHSFGKELEAKNNIKVHCYETDLSNTDTISNNGKEYKTFVVEFYPENKADKGVYFKVWLTQKSPHVSIQSIYASSDDKDDDNTDRISRIRKLLRFNE